MLVNASKVQNCDNCFERPQNLIPLSFYHAALQYYTDKSAVDPVKEIKGLSLYKKFFALLDGQ